MSDDLDQIIEDARREEAELMNPQLRTDRIQRELGNDHERALGGDTAWTEYLDDGEAVASIARMWRVWKKRPKFALAVMSDELDRLLDIAEKRKEARAYDE